MTLMGIFARQPLVDPAGAGAGAREIVGQHSFERLALADLGEEGVLGATLRSS